jgi:hypothetical protein
VGDGIGSAGLLAGDGGSGHNTHVTVANTILTRYGHAIIANQAGGSVDVKVSHSDYDTPVLASAGQVDETDANLHHAPGFADPAGGSFHLSAASTQIDAGDPGAASILTGSASRSPASGAAAARASASPSPRRAA